MLYRVKSSTTSNQMVYSWLVGCFFCFNGPLRQYFSLYRGGGGGWSGGAKVLGKLPVLGGVVRWCDGAG